jgi:putative protease
MKKEWERGRGGEGETPFHSSPPPLPVSPSSTLHLLCRSIEQLEAAIENGVTSVIADFRDLGGYAEAVRGARGNRVKIALATPRIHKPNVRDCPDFRAGENGTVPFHATSDTDVFKLLAELQPDGVLVRNLAGLAFFREAGLPAVADFSLNAVNDLAVEWLCGRGAARVTAAYDLNPRQLLELAEAVPPERLEVMVHRHSPLFHSEYCLFCRFLSQGRNRTDCGRPCERHEVRLRDRRGVAHRLSADSQCRNTLFHAEAENLAEIVPALIERGVRHFRVELLEESTKEQVRRVVSPFMPIKKER